MSLLAIGIGSALYFGRAVATASVGAQTGDVDGRARLAAIVTILLWLTIIFASFGLLAPRNATVVAVLFLCALSVAGSIFLILEMDQPFDGLMKVSGAPLRYAVSHLDQ